MESYIIAFTLNFDKPINVNKTKKILAKYFDVKGIKIYDYVKKDIDNKQFIFFKTISTDFFKELVFEILEIATKFSNNWIVFDLVYDSKNSKLNYFEIINDNYYKKDDFNNLGLKNFSWGHIEIYHENIEIYHENELDKYNC